MIGHTRNPELPVMLLEDLGALYGVRSRPNGGGAGPGDQRRRRAHPRPPGGGAPDVSRTGRMRHGRRLSNVTGAIAEVAAPQSASTWFPLMPQLIVRFLLASCLPATLAHYTETGRPTVSLC